MIATIFVIDLIGAETGMKDTVESPEYKAWSQFKIGTWVKMRQSDGDAVLKGKRSEGGPAILPAGSEIVYKVVEVTPEKVILEGKTNTFTLKQEVPAKVDKRLILAE